MTIIMGIHENRFWGTLDPFYEAGAILGRKVANARFMDFLLAADPFDEYHFFLNGRDARKNLRGSLAALAPGIEGRDGFKVLDRRELPKMLTKGGYHCFHQSDCITCQPHLSRLRNAYSPETFPITGVTHSLSYADYGRQFLQHLWPGATARDCIISTSTAGVEAVKRFLGTLRRDYGLDEACFGPSIRRVPLGIDPQAYTPKPSDGDVCNILVFGRISHYSKMDLLPLIRALHRLFSDGLAPESVRLTLAGWTDDEDDFTPTLCELARNIGLELIIKARPTEAEKTALFQNADLFITIADNPQETFGITVLEAAAFGLPCIASDYDGYKDLVLDGETGMRVPTVGASSTRDADLLAPLIFDNHYHLTLAQQTAVEVPALAEAIRALVENPDLRRRMGEAARTRVEREYSWSVIVEQYLELWEDLWKFPAEKENLREVHHPGHIDYSQIFGHYPTRTLGMDMTLKTGRTGEAMYRGKDFPLLYAGMERLIDSEVLKKIAFLARKPIGCEELLGKILEIATHLSWGRAEYHVLWSLKHDILEIQ